MMGRPAKITVAARFAEPLTSSICKSRRVLLLSSGKIDKISMSTRALKNQPKKNSGRAIALPAPPPPWSLINHFL